MYLVSEAEFNKLRKRHPRSSRLAPDVQVVTNTLKAVSQKAKKKAFARFVPRQRVQLVQRNGVTSMRDEDVVTPLSPPPPPRLRRRAPRHGVAATRGRRRHVRTATHHQHVHGDEHSNASLPLQRFDVGNVSE